MNADVAVNSPLWTVVRGYLEDTFPRDVFRSWFEPLCVLEETPNSLIFGVMNDFTAIWLQENYLDIISNRLRIAAGHDVKISFKVCDREQKVQSDEMRAHGNLARTINKESPKCVRQQITDDPAMILNRQNTFENFVVGSGNQMAHAACTAVANMPGRAYNPLFLYGDTGLGKTHLMQAVAHSVLNKRKRTNVVYTSTERFTNEFIAELQKNSLGAFRRKYRHVDILLIDDVHFLSGKERIQEEFFHTFNELFEAQKQIILSSDRPASEIARLESRLISRFQWGLVADIQSPDLETRIAILDKKASAMDLELPRNVVETLANKVSSNVRKLEGALNRIANYAAITRTEITVELVEHILRDLFSDEQVTEVTMELIKQKTCSYFKLSSEDMVGKKRPASIAFPRQIAMYLCRIMTSRSLADIGTQFGGRDHGTVIHACKTVENTMEQDISVKRTVENLQKAIRQS
ncbi:MAG: chromosomal replication initiator protein DnaA [Puniceicoccales bacterium]|jgi:chromosomal replication initiator protein|nr:chromosomal replication initiator protein DnaA [Puniceicoccales bacterium]